VWALYALHLASSGVRGCRGAPSSRPEQAGALTRQEYSPSIWRGAGNPEPSRRCWIAARHQCAGPTHGRTPSVRGLTESARRPARSCSREAPRAPRDTVIDYKARPRRLSGAANARPHVSATTGTDRPIPISISMIHRSGRRGGRQPQAAEGARGQAYDPRSKTGEADEARPRRRRISTRSEASGFTALH